MGSQGYGARSRAAVPLEVLLVVWAFVYLALRRVLELLVLCWRSADAKEVEILVLRHQLAALIAGRRQLLRVLRVYVEHYNHHRPHRGLGLSAPEPSERCELADSSAAAWQLHRRDVLGGLIHEYERAA
jgi:hypothetical protein